MTEHEHEGRGAVDALRARLGVHYRASVDDGRAEIARALADELNIDRDQADAMVGRLIDSGQIRYISGIEADRGDTGATRYEQRSDADSSTGAPGLAEPDATDRRDLLRSNAIPHEGAPPQRHVSGITAPATAPLVAGGFGAPGATPLAAGVPIGESAEERQRMGYWEFGGGAGVAPSSTRKGQVEPRGT